MAKARAIGKGKLQIVKGKGDWHRQRQRQIQRHWQKTERVTGIKAERNNRGRQKDRQKGQKD